MLNIERKCQLRNLERKLLVEELTLLITGLAFHIIKEGLRADLELKEPTAFFDEPYLDE